jgi:hypothetical protein
MFRFSAGILFIAKYMNESSKQEALAGHYPAKDILQDKILQAPGFQQITGAFLFGLQGTSIIFACRVKKTGQNFQKSLFLSYFSDELIKAISC